MVVSGWIVKYMKLFWDCVCSLIGGSEFLIIFVLKFWDFFNLVLNGGSFFFLYLWILFCVYLIDIGRVGGRKWFVYREN